MVRLEDEKRVADAILLERAARAIRRRWVSRRACPVSVEDLSRDLLWMAHTLRREAEKP